MGVMPNWISIGNVLGGIYRMSRKPNARDAILTTVANLELGLDPVPVVGEQDGWLSPAGAHHMKLWIQFFTNLGHPADGILRCGETCIPEDLACTTDSDCCGGYCSPDGTCGPPQVSCTPLGGSCQDSVECCFGICSASGFCQIEIG